MENGPPITSFLKIRAYNLNINTLGPWLQNVSTPFKSYKYEEKNETKAKLCNIGYFICWRWAYHYDDGRLVFHFITLKSALMILIASFRFVQKKGLMLLCVSVCVQKVASSLGFTLCKCYFTVQNNLF